MELPARFRLLGGGRFGFEVLGRSRDEALRIDPVLGWSTYLGASAEDQVQALLVDDAGCVVLTGVTNSPDFPDTAGIASPRGNGDVFVMRLSPDGSTILYSAVLGGSFGIDPDTMEVLPGDDIPVDIGLQPNGVITVMGWTGSEDFPVTPGCFDPTYNGGIEKNELGDTFVLQIDPSQTGAAQLAYSSFLGGDLIDNGYAVHVDDAGVMTVAGHCHSEFFPTTSDAYQPNIVSTHPGDAFVTRINPQGQGASDLVWSTFLGGSGFDYGYAMVIDATGRVIVGGQAGIGTDFPSTPGAYREVQPGMQDNFVAILDPQIAGAGQLVYSTFLGGSFTERITCMALHPSGDVVIGGVTNSPDMPVKPNPGAFDGSFGGLPNDGFLARLSLGAQGESDLRWCTYLGGVASDEVRGLTIRPTGRVVCAGISNSSDFPTTPGAFQPAYAGGGHHDAFVFALSADGRRMEHGTFLGDVETDRALTLADGPLGNVTFGGLTTSANFPTTPGVLQNSRAGGFLEGFVAQLCPLDCDVPAASFVTGSGNAGVAGVPQLTPSDAPELGDHLFTVRLTSAAPLASGTLVVRSLPGDGASTSAGRLAHLAPSTVSFTTDATGSFTLEFPLACRPRLCGSVYRMEAFVQDGAAVGGVARTRSLTLRVGG